MRGANPYLRAFANVPRPEFPNVPRPSRKVYDDIQNYIGDTLVMELAKSARALEKGKEEEEEEEEERGKGRAPSSRWTGSRLHQSEARWPEVPELEAAVPQWNANARYLSFPRQPHYSARMGGAGAGAGGGGGGGRAEASGQSKRVLTSARRSFAPRHGARQFMIWNNGQYLLG